MHTFKGNEIRKKLVAMECHRRFWKVFKKLGMISVPCSESSRTDPYSTFIHSPLPMGLGLRHGRNCSPDWGWRWSLGRLAAVEQVLGPAALEMLLGWSSTSSTEFPPMNWVSTGHSRPLLSTCLTMTTLQKSFALNECFLKAWHRNSRPFPEFQSEKAATRTPRRRRRRKRTRRRWRESTLVRQRSS